ncbi:DUF3761 domain-containing protein [Streptomyces mirabilis]|uniref:DUF3761 domain-containing protein n=1 Tax=Streptomyces mirabilis TaxID=68239 RepID=UPI0036B36675
MPASRTRPPRSCHGRRSPSSTAPDRHPAAALDAPGAAATDAAAATCARHTTGVCKANSPHPRRATAKSKDGTWSYSAHARVTCSHHRGVTYWYR